MSQSSPSAQPLYTWEGYHYDSATSLYLDRARIYDAGSGRWITQAPLGVDAGDSNLYRYVNNAPFDGIDPSGKAILDLIHATTPQNAAAIVADGLKQGLDGLRWFSTLDAAGSGASADATALLRFELDVTNVRDIPQNILTEANQFANQQLRGQDLGANRARVWARTKWDRIAAWIRTQPAEIVWRTPNPGAGRTGFHYAFQEQAWRSAAPRLAGLSGSGASAAIEALERSASAAPAGEAASASQSAAARWGNRAKVVGRVGGKLLIVVGLANLAYQIYTAENKGRQGAIEAGGWAGALAGGWAGAEVGGTIGLAGGPFAEITVPAGGIIGGLLGGVIGYSAGTKAAELTYDWAFSEGVQVGNGA